MITKELMACAGALLCGLGAIIVSVVYLARCIHEAHTRRHAELHHLVLKEHIRELRQLAHDDPQALPWKCIQLSYQLDFALRDAMRPKRNVDRFKTWKEAMRWFYEHDRKNPDTVQVGLSAAFLNFLFAPYKG